MLSLVLVLSMVWGCGCGSATAAYQYSTALMNYQEGTEIWPEDTEDPGMYVWGETDWMKWHVYFVWEDVLEMDEDGDAYPEEVITKYYELKEARETKPYVSEEYMAELAYNSRTNEWP